MTIKEIVKLSATYLGLYDVLSLLAKTDETGGILSGDEAGVKETNLLTLCSNIIVDELACTYFPMIKTEKKNAVNGKILFSELSENVTEIKKVENVAGRDIRFVSGFDGIEVSEGVAVITYRFSPPNYGLDETVAFKEDIPLRIMAYGVCAEYCLTEKNFDESVMWRNRFVNSLCEFIKPENKRIKERSFI